MIFTQEDAPKRYNLCNTGWTIVSRKEEIIRIESNCKDENMYLHMLHARNFYLCYTKPKCKNLHISTSGVKLKKNQSHLKNEFPQFQS